jgi:hypothetical protein
MAEKKSKLEEWQEIARRKARELDEKLHLKERLEEGAKVAQGAAKESFRVAQQAAHDGAKVAQDVLKEGAPLSEAVKQGARIAQETAKEGAKVAQETVKEGVRVAQEAAQPVADSFAETAGKVREQAGRVEDAFGVREQAQAAGEVLKQAAATATATANTMFSGAQKVYGKAAQAYGTGASLKRATDAAVAGARKAAAWAQENPVKAGAVTASVVLGIPLGVAFPKLDAILFGAHPHWFTHSALPVYGLRKAGEKFDQYLQGQEKLIAEGKLDEAEQSRVEFERNIVKYVGAPLLGAFSCAAGVAMWAQIFQPGRLVGFPIGWIFGGNPVFDGIWLFGNGVLCFHQGYKFFMIALADQAEVQRVVKEIKGLLPAAA